MTHLKSGHERQAMTVELDPSDEHSAHAKLLEWVGAVMSLPEFEIGSPMFNLLDSVADAIVVYEQVYWPLEEFALPESNAETAADAPGVGDEKK